MMAEKTEDHLGEECKPTSWQALSLGSLGAYEYECNNDGPTGWCRCANGRLADGKWPEWNVNTGRVRNR